MANLWIRSQDKKIFRKTYSIYYSEGLNGENVISDECCNALGEYSTKERCIEIIDEIQKLLTTANPQNAFVVLKNIVDTYEETKFYVERARKDNFFAYFGEKNSDVSFLQPSVLVYEMPEE